MLGNGWFRFLAALPGRLPRLDRDSAARAAATRRHLRPRARAGRAGAARPADHRRLASPVEEAQGPPAPGDRTRIVRFPVGEQVDAVALRFPHHRGRIFSALLSPLASMAPPAPSRPHLRGIFQIICELAGMALRIGEDLQQEPPCRRIPLAELAHEGGVRRHLLPFEHEVLNDHLA